jgi:Rha family phage regulatory protein
MNTTTMPVATELVTLENGKAMTTSLKVAEVFGKEHKHVMRDIEALECSADFRKSNFGLSSYSVPNNRRPYPMYLMTRDGFTFLAMGFNGKRAAQFKEKYIEAFNRMEAELMKRQANVLPDFTNPVEAARAWADQVEQKMALEAQAKALAPKAAVYEKAFADRCITIARFARTLRGVNSMKVKEDLMNAGYLYRRHSGAPYKVRSQYREKLFAEKVYGERGYVEIIVLDKGKQKIVELYRAGKLTMKRGYENAYKGAA